MVRLMKFLGGNFMLGKLLKNDLKKNLRLLLILFGSTLAVAGLARGINELGENVAFFKILGIIFNSIFYALAANSIIQPFLRSFLNFTKSFYSDESYLTHTLPVPKNHLINSKFLTALIEITSGFMIVVLSLLILFGSPTLFDTLKLLLSTLITGEFSLFWVLFLIVALIIVEFIMYISIIYFSIVLAYRARERRVMTAFLYTALFAFASLSVLSVFMVVIMLANNISLTSTMLTLSNKAFFSIIVAGILVYSGISVLFYYLTKKAFRKGVNVD